MNDGAMWTTTNILAALVNPALLVGGAGAVALPILIHLLARRRFRRLRWAAMDFLIDAERHNRRRVRFEEWVLLLLRCLAVLLVASVVARPFVSPTGVAAILGSGDRTERLFVIDDSFSMGYLTDGQTALERAKTSVVNLVNRLREHSPDDTITVLRTSRPDSPLVSGALLDYRQVEQILALLEALTVSQRGLSVEDCVRAATDALARDSGITSAVIYVISDFQRIDWVDRIGDAGAGDSPVGPLVRWATEGRSVRIVLIDVGDDAAENFALTQLSPGQRQMVTGVEGRVAATVANYAAHDSDAIELAIVAGQTARASARLDRLPAGRSATTTIPVYFQSPGDAIVQVETPPDNLAVDNVRVLTVDVSEAIDILVVNGEPSSDSYLDEAHLLAAALRPEGEVFSGNRTHVIEEAEIDTASFDKYHLVILCNLYRVSEPVADALHRYVANGGGLAIFLGDQVSDPALYNASLFRDGAGLMPARLQAVVHAPQSGAALAGTDLFHPVVTVFAGRENPFLKRVRFTQYFSAEPATSGAGQVATSTTAPAAGPPARIIACFDDAERTPAIVERTFGRGRVILFASSCDLEWNDWAKDPSYVIAMLEVAQYLARSTDADRCSLVGQELILPVDPSEFELVATVRGPGYPQQRGEELTATASSGEMSFRWSDTQRSGVYSFVMRRRDGTEAVRRFAVNLDERESDLAPADEEDLRRALGGIPVDYITGVAAARDESDTGRKELWPLVLAACMATLMLEHLLAWRFGRSGTVPGR